MSVVCLKGNCSLFRRRVIKRKLAMKFVVFIFSAEMAIERTVVVT
jgi:hypothetical protein